MFLPVDKAMCALTVKESMSVELRTSLSNGVGAGSGSTMMIQCTA